MTNRQKSTQLLAAVIALIGLQAVAATDETPVSWVGKTEFGKFELVLNADGSRITKVHIDLPDWNCGRDTYSDYVGYIPVQPLPISDGEFSITTGLGPGGQSITIMGVFDSSAKGSGTWQAVSGGEECNGTWKSPQEVMGSE